MKDYLTPDRMFGGYAEVTPELLREAGIRALLMDIDNTLAPYEEADPPEQLINWIRTMRESGIRMALVSNNHAPRVERFNRSLGLPAYPDSHKPRRGTLVRAMQKLGVGRSETAVLGDQLLTDAYAGKHIGLRAWIVPPIRDKKNLFFRFKRLCERPFIRKYARLHGYQPWMSFWKIRNPKAKENIK